jgi:hypothetical protein
MQVTYLGNEEVWIELEEAHIILLTKTSASLQSNYIYFPSALSYDLVIPGEPMIFLSCFTGFRTPALVFVCLRYTLHISFKSMN